MVCVPEVLRGIFPGWAGGLSGLIFSGWLQGTDALSPAQSSCSMSFMDFPASQTTIHLFRDPGLVSSECARGRPRLLWLWPDYLKGYWTGAGLTLGNFPFFFVKGL